jgi:hypothetical protein
MTKKMIWVNYSLHENKKKTKQTKKRKKSVCGGGFSNFSKVERSVDRG